MVGDTGAFVGKTGGLGALVGSGTGGCVGQLLHVLRQMFLIGVPSMVFLRHRFFFCLAATQLHLTALDFFFLFFTLNFPPLSLHACAVERSGTIQSKMRRRMSRMLEALF